LKNKYLNTYLAMQIQIRTSEQPVDDEEVNRKSEDRRN